MNRTEAIRYIVDENPESIFVFSNGLTTREAVHVLGLEGPYLYLLHGMGESLSVGAGIATATKNIVVVIDGDGNAAMGMASWPSLNKLDNLKYYIIDNSGYETTGGQTVPEFRTFLSEKIIRIPIKPGTCDAPVPPSPEILIESFKRSMEKYAKQQTNHS